MNSLIRCKNLARLIVITSIFFSFNTVYAASFYTQVSKTQVTPGSLINFQVFINTDGQVINNAEGVIEYPPDLLEVVSVDKNSVFSLWVQEPAYLNSIGNLSFNGGVPNPGYQGRGGRVLGATFRAKKAGTANIIFSDGAIRANDGLGTDILTSKSGSQLAIAGAEPEKPKTTPIAIAFSLTSSTHPNQNNWYNRNDVELLWSLPKGAEGVKTLLDSSATSEPNVYYNSPLGSKSIKDLKDGTWYFHVSYSKDGAWSQPQHFRLKIDTTEPTDLTAEAIPDDSGNVMVKMKATDSASGVDRFKVTSANGQTVTVKSDSRGEATAKLTGLSDTTEGITVVAYDGAGNSATFAIGSAPTASAKIKIDYYSAKVQTDDVIEVGGLTPTPDLAIRILVKDENGLTKTYKTKSDSTGKFYVETDGVAQEGKYTVWAEAVGEAKSANGDSNKLSVTVEKPLVVQVGSYSMNFMLALAIALSIILAFVALILYQRFKLVTFSHRTRKHGLVAEKVIGKSLETMKKNINKRGLELKKAKTKGKEIVEEPEFLEKMKGEIKDLEQIIDQQIKNISK